MILTTFQMDAFYLVRLLFGTVLRTHIHRFPSPKIPQPTVVREHCRYCLLLLKGMACVAVFFQSQRVDFVMRSSFSASGDGMSHVPSQILYVARRLMQICCDCLPFDGWGILGNKTAVAKVDKELLEYSLALIYLYS